MKLSLNWIKDYAKLPEDMDLSRLAYTIAVSALVLVVPFIMGVFMSGLSSNLG